MTDGFTKTGLFSETDKFSETNDFTKSGLFSSSNGCVQTSFFSKSGRFSESADFSNTKFFSESIEFSISCHFTDSNYYIFTSTELFVHRNVIIDIKQDENRCWSCMLSCCDCRCNNCWNIFLKKTKIGKY
ncbi:hypothetical protein M9Y10_015584 [Tritrichomonas musculus]|uniref:Uncharacterized protein n=1 Tax=Tritrichomonas musculus TaxID=1915356 RepID=A0ABR2L2P4_9EUKA